MDIRDLLNRVDWGYFFRRFAVLFLSLLFSVAIILHSHGWRYENFYNEILFTPDMLLSILTLLIISLLDIFEPDNRMTSNMKSVFVIAVLIAALTNIIALGVMTNNDVSEFQFNLYALGLLLLIVVYIPMYLFIAYYKRGQ